MKSFSLFLILFLLSSAATLAQTDPEILRGELNGSPYTIALPAAWQSGNLFFHVHGWRPAEAPHEADLDTDDPFYRFLLENG